ncbi:MAG: hypothetical protein HYY08_02955 [Firmicutes bacterium]|nr:hypothetical protein [Bacillota bacterium]
MKEISLGPEEFFELSGFVHASIFEGIEFVWEALKRLDEYIKENLRPDLDGTVMDGAWVGEQVYLGPGALVEPGAMIKGPAIIGAGTVVRQGAYVREGCLIGDGCVVGHTSELKGVIMLDNSQAPHFAYVGDSILGRKVNLGAGTKLSNLKNDGSEVMVDTNRGDGARICTGMRKFGAILGDGVATGCNCVTSPGTLVGPGSMVYPCAVLRGVYPARSIIKLRQHLEVIELSER